MAQISSLKKIQLTQKPIAQAGA